MRFLEKLRDDTQRMMQGIRDLLAELDRRDAENLSRYAAAKLAYGKPARSSVEFAAPQDIGEIMRLTNAERNRITVLAGMRVFVPVEAAELALLASKVLADLATTERERNEARVAVHELRAINVMPGVTLGYVTELKRERDEQKRLADERLKALETLHTLWPLEEYHEDCGAVLWWHPPINEPPYCGDPLTSDWPGYHTHWSPLPSSNELQDQFAAQRYRDCLDVALKNWKKWFRRTGAVGKKG